MNSLRPWSSWLLSSKKALSRSKRGWWAGVAIAVLASILILIGVIWLVVSVTLFVVYSTDQSFYMTVPFFILQLLLSVAMIGIGAYLVMISMWKVGASVERRGALITQAAEFDLLKDLRGFREQMPTVPTNFIAPSSGTVLDYRLHASRRNLWGLVGAAAVFVLFVGLGVVLVILTYYKFSLQLDDYSSAALAIPFLIAAVWSFGYFVRQVLKLTSIGPTILEISDYPVIPGKAYQIQLSQSGRLRIQLLDVTLVCYEEATFRQGTNIRTERKPVYTSRLFRRRGINVDSNSSFQTEFEMLIPDGAMHSFISDSNRIQWKIEIYGQAKGFPRVRRSFELIVLPHDLGPEKAEQGRSGVAM